MKLPKLAIAQTEPGDVWGVVRLRNPVLLVEYVETASEILGPRTPRVWPPDARSLTTSRKFDRTLSGMGKYLRTWDEFPVDTLPPTLDLAQEIPRFLLLDDEPSDFSGVIDTTRGILWSIDETARGLELVADWRMHPHHAPRLDWPEMHREVSAWYSDFLREQARLEAEELD